jgi:tetratricopeptide (TPR) repeat protein
MRALALSTVPLVVLLSSACGSSSTSTEPARRYEGFGAYHREITTTSQEAQEWFDQGMQLLYGFNHDEAIRSFQAATEADPTCAMAWWGIAYANGLDINNQEITHDEALAAWEAAQKAQSRFSNGTPEEWALCQAIGRRYEWPNPEDRRHLDQAYAKAMQDAWGIYRTDPDIGALYAESLMNLQPWDLWTKDGEPKGRTPEIVAVLERVLQLDPDHPGANHFYIHTVEASNDPERALPAADRLVDLVPGAGHLVHMPSHVYARVGRYADAADANERAIAADLAYFALAPPADFYNIYFIHNAHFLAYAAMMEGRYEKAMEAARRIETEVPEEFLRERTEYADGLMSTTLHVLIRFGEWEQILAEPEPAEYRLMSRSMWHYARGVAYSATDRTEEARAEYEAFKEVGLQVPVVWTVGNNTTAQVLTLAHDMLLGELLYREGDVEGGLASLRKGIELEDDLVYDEPPGWMQPIRHPLGALLMAEGRYADAEEVYREDLVRNPGNGWSLLGLEQALVAQGREDEADPVRAARAVAWRRSDVAPSSSCYCEPGDLDEGL